jgi:hypothetical protein
VLYEATRAIRTDGDPTRGAALLERWFAAHPDGGPLAEEATALAVEAAVLQGDRAAAARWAGRYLARFPDGRHADEARRALRP